MKVRMTTQIGGYNGGQPWPGPGEVVDVTATEAFDMVASGYATYVDGGEVTTREADRGDDGPPDAGDGDSGPVSDDVKPARKRTARKS